MEDRIIRSLARFLLRAVKRPRIQQGNPIAAEPAGSTGPLPWRTPQRREPWKDFGLECPTDDRNHQPHPSPWFSGESVFAPNGQKYRQPKGPFFHAAFPRRDATPLLKVGDVLSSPAERRDAVPLLEVGDVLSSPASRRSLPNHLSGALTRDGCIAYAPYDVHAVYVSTARWPADLLYYEVEPEGFLWPDPERGVSEAWCAVRARITTVHVPTGIESYWSADTELRAPEASACPSATTNLLGPETF